MGSIQECQEERQLISTLMPVSWGVVATFVHSQGTGQSAQSADGKRVFILDVSVPGIAHVVLMQNLPKNKEWILSVIKAHSSSWKHLWMGSGSSQKV